MPLVFNTSIVPKYSNIAKIKFLITKTNKKNITLNEHFSHINPPSFSLPSYKRQKKNI